MSVNNKFSAGIILLSSFLLFAFWTCFALFLPMQQEYLNWVLDDDWTWVNIIGFSGSALGVPAVLILYNNIENKKRIMYLALLAAIFGVIMLSSLLFFEAFILKGIAIQSPEIIKLNQGFYAEISFVTANIIGGVLFSIGFIGLSFEMILQKSFKRWKLILLIIGAPLFGLVIIPGNFRLLGVLLFVISNITIAIELMRKK